MSSEKSSEEEFKKLLFAAECDIRKIFEDSNLRVSNLHVIAMFRIAAWWSLSALIVDIDDLHKELKLIHEAFRDQEAARARGGDTNQPSSVGDNGTAPLGVQSEPDSNAVE